MNDDIHLTYAMSDEQCDKLSGKMLDVGSFDVLVSGESQRVFKPDGNLLLYYMHGVIPQEVCVSAFESLKGAAGVTRNRGLSAGEIDLSEADKLPGKVEVVDGTRAVRRKGDGTLSQTNEAKPVNSGIIGYYDRSVRMPYCRQTQWNIDNQDKFSKALPFIKACSNAFKRGASERYEAQRKVIEDTSGDFVISDTVFTTITVNSNWQTAVHKDQGDYKPGLGVMSVLRAGKYEGAYLCFPKYRAAVDMSTGGVCLADVHEWHGNTPIENPTLTKYQRLSCVMYYRNKMRYCGNADQELERVKARKRGDPIDGFVD